MFPCKYNGVCEKYMALGYIDPMIVQIQDLILNLIHWLYKLVFEVFIQ